jgi:hypothetical protein
LDVRLKKTEFAAGTEDSYWFPIESRREALSSGIEGPLRVSNHSLRAQCWGDFRHSRPILLNQGIKEETH